MLRAVERQDRNIAIALDQQDRFSLFAHARVPSVLRIQFGRPALRADDAEGGPAILIISAEAQALAARSKAEIYHDDYLVKPFEVNKLLERIETLLDLEWVRETARAPIRHDA